MANPYDQMKTVNTSLESALNTLNEKDYINKLYGSNEEANQKLIQENYTDNTGILNAEQNRVQQQTQDNVNRTQVEANSNPQNVYNGPKLSYGANQQASLTQENALRGNTNQLNQGLQLAQQEIERQRQILKSQYETAIKQAQAENDMQKAQALYEAAKKEDQQLLSALQKEANVYKSFGDEGTYESIMQRLISGGVPSASMGGNTTADVLRYEDQIREVYDNKSEAANLELRSKLAETLSDLQAKQEDQERQTDEKLTETYVQALQKAKNYAEVQNAYGMGSGSFGQAQLAQDTELQKALTDLRLLQLDTSRQNAGQQLDAYKDFSKNLQQRQAAINLDRAREMLAAAESQEEQQMAMAELMLQYKLMNEESGGGGGGGYSGGGGSYGGDDDEGYYKDWSNKDLQDKANQGVANHKANSTPLSSSAKKEHAKPTVIRGSTSSSKKVM